MNRIETKAVTPRLPRSLGGRYFRTAEAEAAGVPRAQLYRMWRSGEVFRLSRGLFSTKRVDLSGRETLAEAAERVPNGVICLLSALAFHGLTTQLPREVWMALPEKAWKPSLKDLPVHIVRFSGQAYSEGIDLHKVKNAELRVYSPAKTVADCFKYRHKIGLEVALEALRDYWRQRRGSIEDLERYASVCRVTNVLRPYLEALTIES